MLNKTASRFGQGTWMLEKDDREQAVGALRLGVNLGMTLIDTAEMYGSGRAEEIVGEAIADLRERIFLVSKVLPSNASYDGTRRACDRSLQRLRTDYLDLYLLHWPGAHPIGETMRALESLVKEKKVRQIGVSNFDVAALDEARRALKHEPLACNQVLYHLKDRGIERKLIPYCAQHDIAVMGYSPFGHHTMPKHAALTQVAERRQATVRQVMLAFLARAAFAIPKSGSPEHVRENAGAAALSLTEADVREIDQAFPAPARDVPLGML